MPIEKITALHEADLCPGSGTEGRMVDHDFTDDWHVVCPLCSREWVGGSTLLRDHVAWRD